MEDKQELEDQIKELEHYIAEGDIPRMARVVNMLREEWDSLSEDMQKDVQKLEAIFLSMVNEKVEDCHEHS